MSDQPDIYSKAENELSSIEIQLATLAKRKDDLAAFVALGRKLYEQSTGLDHRDNPLQHIAKSFERQRTARDESMKARVLKMARKAIETNGPTTTAKLVETIEATGLLIKGANKATTVSVILSRSNDFVSDRTEGWKLAQKSPQDAPTSAGSSPAQAGLQLERP